MGRLAALCQGDIKPENILVDENGDCFLCDFELAVDVSNVTAGPKSHIALGATETAKAPELYDSERLPLPAQMKADIYAWGQLVFDIESLLSELTGFYRVLT